MPGPSDSIKGLFGYLPLVETGFDTARMLLGDGFRIDEVSWKPFPTGHAAHGAIVATEALMRDHGVTADDRARLDYCARR